MSIRAVNEFILLEVVEGEEVMKTGLIVASEKQDRTESIAIRAVVKSIPKTLETELKVGDTIFASKWDAHHAHLQGTHYLLIKHKDILGVIEE